MKLDNFIINITLAVKGDEIHRKAMTREDESSHLLQKNWGGRNGCYNVRDLGLCLKNDSTFRKGITDYIFSSMLACTFSSVLKFTVL